ncbi:hypothetical protein [Qipengyuania sp. JC766]|uniref:hypothetical protein n=1 Tax=Qipengyuania sp. JC766 TaxID=3232139 RepID=UPI0034577D64
MLIRNLLIVPALSSILAGCLLNTAADIVTAPVRIASKGVDLVTTSQSEADEKRGREIRRREERLGKLQRELDDKRRNCSKGSAKACRQAGRIEEEMQALLPTIPSEPDNR